MSGATWNDHVLTRWRGSDHAAVVTPDTTWSGDELLQRASGAAAWLSERGFPAGAPVPALLDASPTAIALVTGGAFARRPLAPLGTKLPPEQLAVAARACSEVGIVTTTELVASAREVARLAGLTLHVLDGPPPPRPIVEPAASPDDLALVIHTSGTTGAPKRVPVTHRALVARLAVYRATMGIGDGDRYVSASPFHHTAGVTMVFTVLGLGGAVLPQARFSVEGWREAGRLGVTHALLVPTMIDLLLAEGALADARPRLLQYGAAPIHVATLAEALAALPDTRFLQIFGQTEVSPLTALTHDDHLLGLRSRPELLTTVGRAVIDTELRVEGPDLDGIGEIAVRAPHAFVVDDDGWRRTGDLGRIDAEGYVTLHGRVGDRIIRGGENIYPIEVERALVTHPAVREVAVVGMPDRRWGEVVKAVVVPVDAAAAPTLAELQTFARPHLASFKLPTVLDVVDELPRNASGKLLRYALIGAPA